jgi:RNA 2',3'-cyclic 3'-phosphodiesterase
VTSAGSVERDERLRLFLALRLPHDVLDALAAWQGRELVVGRAGDGRSEAGRIVPREHLHITLAFLGSRPVEELPAVRGVLAECVARADPITLAPERYRETRSVGMLVLRDDGGGAARLAACVQERLEELRLYRREARPWLPHVTVLRFRERPRLLPPVPRLGPFAPSDAAAYLSRLRPSGAQYEVLEVCLLER